MGEFNFDENEIEPEREVIIRSKWIIDGAKTLTEAAQMHRSEAADLLKLERQGWQLVQPVEDDYGIIRKRDDPSARL